ncbi:MAG: TolC family protein [Bacteroidales bacterium]|nr:TolC family protein [Bacteroidales bacterium]
MKYLIQIILVLLLAESSAYTQTDSVTAKHYLSLEDAKNYAIEHNYQNKNSAIDKDISKKQQWEYLAIGFPQLNATAEYQNMLNLPTSLLPGEIVGRPGEYIPVQFGQQHNASWGVTATQIIFNGSYIVGVEAAKILTELASQTYTKSSLSIEETVTKSYYLVLIAEESKKILEETKVNFENLLKEIEESHRLGFVEDIDVDQLRLTKQNNDNTIISIDNQIELAYRLLKYQLGIDYNDKIILTDSLDKFTKNIDDAYLLGEQLELNKNIDYKIMQSQEGLKLSALKNEKSQYLPQISGFMSYSQNAYDNDFSKLFSKWYTTHIVGIQINIPIFSSGMRNARVQQAKLVLEKVKNSKAELEQGLNLQVEQLRSNYINAKLKFENEKWNMELSKKINNKTEKKYKQGMASANDLMLTQNQYLMALNNYYQALSQLLSVSSELYYLLQKN